MTDDDAIFAHILAEPASDLHRLVFADWLEERAGTKPCDTCDRYIHIGKMPDDVNLRNPHWLDCPTCHGTGSVSDLRRERAEFVRLQCEIARLAVGSGHGKITPLAWSCKCEVCETAKPLRRREGELFHAHQFQWFDLPTNWKASLDNDLDGRPLARVSRGFVSRVTCPLADFLSHAAAIFGAAPVTEVTLSDREPEDNIAACISEGGESWDWSNEEAGGLRTRLPPSLFGLVRREAKKDYINGLNLADDIANYAEFPTREAATNALSRAAVAYGRQLAGLPPL